ncbi:MAG: hypothetical protein IJJ33_14725, partial [Victivallales bacterium]|nr:hypothetical protein [Victivallales bacterium]
MKHIMIACLDKDRQSAVEALGRLGTVHVTPMSAPASEELDSLRKRHDNLLKVINAFQGLEVQPSPGVNDSPEELVDQALALMEERQQCQEQERSTELAITALQPWGSFDRAQLETLADRGLHVYPCQAAKAKLLELLEAPLSDAVHAYPLKQPKDLPQGTVCQILSKTKDVVRFAIISREALDESRLPLAQLPAQTDLKQLHRDLNALRQRQADLGVQLKKLAARSGALEDYRQKLDSQIEFATARDSMASSNRLAFLKGYVPETKLDAVRMAARTNGWAIRHEDVAEDDGDVPVHLLIPRPFRMAQAIF